ncbi:MAG: EamA family transporter [Sphingobacteriales bacterium]|jgi:drug/metabolite transporter (DMT)-like permease|nr:EamA family transporter [Sphingobacteriales bacterium]
MLFSSCHELTNLLGYFGYTLTNIFSKLHYQGIIFGLRKIILKQHPLLFPWLAFAAVSIFWGTTFLAISIGVKTFPPLFMAACRHTIAGLLLLSYFLLRGYTIPKLASLKTFSLNGILMLAGGNGIISWGMQYVGSGLTALICALTPVWIVLINRVSGNQEKLHPLAVLGFVICLLGQFFLFKDKVALFKDEMFIWGVLAVVLSNFLWALGTVYAKNHQTQIHPMYVSAWQMIPGGLFLFIMAFFRGELHAFAPAPEAINALLYLIIFGSILGYGSYMYVIKKLPATIVSTYAYINTLVAIILGWFWLHEGMDFSTLIAIVLTISGVYLVSRNS